MNIFVLDLNHERCAQYHCDKHVVKMIVESCQLLSTAVRFHGYDGDDVYRSTHIHHPCAVWVRKSRSNFQWLLDLTLELLVEYTYRYERVHKSLAVYLRLRKLARFIPKGPMTRMRQTMPEKYRSTDVVRAYRAFYIGEKRRFAEWRYSETPLWYRRKTCTR